MGCKTSTERKESNSFRKHIDPLASSGEQRTATATRALLFMEEKQRLPQRGRSTASRRSSSCGSQPTTTTPGLNRRGGSSARARASSAISRAIQEKDLADRLHNQQKGGSGGLIPPGELSSSHGLSNPVLSRKKRKKKKKEEQEQQLDDENSSVRRGSNKKRRSRKGEKEKQSVDGDDEGFLEYEFEWELDLVKKSSSSCLPCHQGKSTSTPDLGGSDVDFGLGADLTPLQKSGGGPSDLEREKSATDAENYTDDCDCGDQRASEGVKKKRDAAIIEQLIESPKGGEVSPENSDSNNCILLLPPSMPLLQLLLPSKECEAEESVDGEVTGGTTTANSSSCSIVDRNVNGSGTPLQQHPSVLGRGWGGSGSGSTVRSALKGGGGGLEWNNSSSFVDGGGGDVGPTPILSRRRSVGFHRPSSSAARTTTIAVATTTTSLSER